MIDQDAWMWKIPSRSEELSARQKDRWQKIEKLNSKIRDLNFKIQKLESEIKRLNEAF